MFLIKHGGTLILKKTVMCKDIYFIINSDISWKIRIVNLDFMVTLNA